MISMSKHRWLVVALVHYVTLFFVNQANHYLAPIGIHLIVWGMFIAFSAFELNFKQGLFSLIPIALLADSKSPLPFGFSFALFACLFTVVYSVRTRMRRELNASFLVASTLFTMLAFFGYTFGAIQHLGGHGLHIGALTLDLFASLVVVFLLNKLFFDLQVSTLALVGINLAEEQRDAR